MPKILKILLETVAAVVAVIGGIEVGFLVFVWPAFTSRHQDFMLMWGWIGWIPGMLIGYYFAGMLRRLARRILFSSKVNRIDYFYALAWLLVLGIVMVLLFNHGKVDIRWREQVRMFGYDEFIYLDRRVKRESEYSDEGTEISIEVVQLPDGWNSPPVWRKEYEPLLLDYQPDRRVWSIVATFSYCSGWERLGRPKLPYVEYQSRDGGPWEVVPLEERLIGRNTNLLTSPRSDGERELVTAEERDKRNRSAANEDRKIVAKWHNSCSPIGGKEND
jgi:hypothetical protein